MESLRNTSTVLFTLLLCWSVPSYSEQNPKSEFDFRPPSSEPNLSLELECQIKDQSVLGVVDGQPKTYSGVENSFGIGDSLSLKLTSLVNDPPYMMFFQLDWGEENQSMSFYQLENLEVHSDKKGGVIPQSGTNYFYFTEDEINIESELYSTEVSLRRYYKSDFDGFIVIGPKYTTQHLIVVNSVDCRTKTNNLTDLLQYGKP